MSFWIIEVSCSVCELRGEVRSGFWGAEYRLPDGAAVAIISDLAWCPQCATVVEAELEIPSLADLVQELEECENDGPAAKAYLKDAAELRDPFEALDYHVQVLRERVRWRRLRRSSPRCLRCGEHGFEPLGRFTNPHTMPHPNCVGMLTLRYVAHASGEGDIPYSPEGKRLGR